MAADATSRIQAGKLFVVDGMNFVITGGGSGLGAMMARAFATNGANKVFIIGRRLDALQRTVDSIPDGSKTIVPIEGDVTSAESLKAAVEVVKSHVPHIDVLIANSGVGGPLVPFRDAQDKPLPIDQVAEAILNQDVDKAVDCFRVNVIAVNSTVGAFLPLLDAANKARPEPNLENFRPRPQIVVVSSLAAYSRPAFSGLTYGPSKAAVLQLTKMLSTMLIPYHIRANVICPGLYITEMTERNYRGKGPTNVEGSLPIERFPATRSGDDQDMAGSMLWLCSRAGAFINGNALVMDGGSLSAMPSTY